MKGKNQLSLFCLSSLLGTIIVWFGCNAKLKKLFFNTCELGLPDPLWLLYREPPPAGDF